MSSPAEQRAGGLLAEPESAVADVPAPVEALAPAPRAVEEAASAGADDAGDAFGHPLVQGLMLDPARWRIWPAVAVLRWLQRRAGRVGRRLVYRSQPSLGFAGSEIRDVAIRDGHLELTLNAPGLAAAGSPLPSSDIARIIADARDGGALGFWLDGPVDLFMQALETMQAQSNAPFALITGGQVDSHRLLADVVGRSAPLTAGAHGALFDTRRREPEGAIGLAGLFFGPVSASGLGGLFRAFTGLPVRIEEFTGADLMTARPARVGYPMRAMLGARCNLPSAGVEIHIEGGSDPDARKWARDPVRRRSLHLLALTYVGARSPVVRVLLWLDPGNAPPAELDDGAAFGGLAVLGEADHRVMLPLTI